MALLWGVAGRGALTGLVWSQPHPRAEAHRHRVFQHVAKLIRHVAKIEDEEEVLVYSFGSVPLKTYLPHGDLDLTAFSGNDKWLQLLKTRLEEQARTSPAQFSRAGPGDPRCNEGVRHVLRIRSAAPFDAAEARVLGGLGGAASCARPGVLPSH